MLNGFSVTNYKAFEEARMEIRPITLLLGANNIGKTSLLQFLMMLQQTALASEKYQSALKLYGGYLSLGQGKNIFRNFEMKSDVKFSLDFKDGSVAAKLSNELIPEKLSDLWNFFRLTSHVLEDNESNLGDIRFVNRIYQHRLYDKGFYELGNEFDETIDNLSSAAKRMRVIWNRSDKGKRDLLGNLNPTYQNLDLRKEEVKDAFHFVLAIARKLRSEANFKMNFSISHQNDSLRISEFSLLSGEEELMRIEFPNNQNKKFNFKSSIASPHFIQPKFIETLRHFFHQPKTIFAFINKDPKEASDGREFQFLARTVATVLSVILGSIDDYFEEKNVNYVSPLRAHPKRYYFLDKAKINLYLDTLDGDAMAEVLKDNDDVQRLVNNWLRKFGLNVGVNPFEDIIHRLVVKQDNNLMLDITDVGFGISQVLPVVIQGFLSSNDSITLIEQPEIHLHPKMQADLADLFIDIVRKKKNKKNVYLKSLVIETHSEYILRRLRRRISEGEIDPESVGIYVVSKSTDDFSDRSIIKQVDIDADGNFDYPEEFYGGELFKDMVNARKS